MSDLQDFFESLKTNVSVSTVSYVHFEAETGKIQKISTRPTKLDGLELLEVSYNEVRDILNGMKKTDDFFVSYDVVSKQLGLKEITYDLDLDTVNDRLYELPSYRISPNNNHNIIFEEIYEGVDVNIWVRQNSYQTGMLVWYKNKVYKVLEDFTKNDDYFDETKVELFIENVFITDTKSLNKEFKKTIFKPIYDGVHIDVWYNELEHLTGQHVWFENSVYKITKDQKANTKFDPTNAELIIDNILLHSDENQSLLFEKELVHGDKVLDNNKLYIYQDSKVINESLSELVMFFINDFESAVYDPNLKSFVKMSLIEKTDNLEVSLEPIEQEIEVTNANNLITGQQVLLGKKLYIANPLDEYDFEISLVQNVRKECWEIFLNKSTRNSLIKSKYNGNELMFFSITAKHDPNILYRSLKFNIQDLIKDRKHTYYYQYDWEFNKQDVSIYTPKFFNSYAHEILE